MNRSDLNRRQLAAWAGMVGLAVFVLVFTLEGWLRPGYKPLEMYISALSLGPHGWIQMSNFVVFGALLFLFTRGVAAEFPDGKASRGGLILLTILAAFYLLSGPFVMDPTGTPQEQMTVHGTIHGILGGIVFLLMPISIFVYLRRFRLDPKWQSLKGWTLGLGILSAAGVLFFTFTSKLPALQSAFADWQGLIQRTALVPFMIWVFLFGLGLRSQINKK